MDSQHIQELILTWAPLVFFGIIVVLLLMTLRFMPRVKPAAIEKESASSVVWSDIAGVDEAKAELMEVVEFLKDRRRFERLGASIPKGVLLYGHRDGKTLLAKAVARESGANFSRRVPRPSWRCSPVLAPRGSASSSPRRARMRRRSCSSTSSMR